MGYLLNAFLIGLMGYSWYFSDGSYLNIVTVIYSLLIILSIVASPFLCFFSYSDNLKDEQIVAIRKWLKPSIFKRIYSVAIMLTSITLLFLNDYVALVIFYVIATVWSNLMRACGNQNI